MSFTGGLPCHGYIARQIKNNPEKYDEFLSQYVDSMKKSMVDMGSIKSGVLNIMLQFGLNIDENVLDNLASAKAPKCSCSDYLGSFPCLNKDICKICSKAPKKVFVNSNVDAERIILSYMMNNRNGFDYVIGQNAKTTHFTSLVDLGSMIQASDDSKLFSLYGSLFDTLYHLDKEALDAFYSLPDIDSKCNYLLTNLDLCFGGKISRKLYEKMCISYMAVSVPTKDEVDIALKSVVIEKKHPRKKRSKDSDSLEGQLGMDFEIMEQNKNNSVDFSSMFSFSFDTSVKDTNVSEASAINSFLDDLIELTGNFGENIKKDNSLEHIKPASQNDDKFLSEDEAVPEINRPLNGNCMFLSGEDAERAMMRESYEKYGYDAIEIPADNDEQEGSDELGMSLEIDDEDIPLYCFQKDNEEDNCDIGQTSQAEVELQGQEISDGSDKRSDTNDEVNEIKDSNSQAEQEKQIQTENEKSVDGIETVPKEIVTEIETVTKIAGKGKPKTNEAEVSKSTAYENRPSLCEKSLVGSLPVYGSELAYFGCDISSLSAKNSNNLVRAVMRDKRLSIEKVEDENRNSYLVIYVYGLKKYFFADLMNEVSRNRLRDVLSFPSIKKYCYNLFETVSYITGNGLMVKGIYSLFVASYLIFPSHNISYAAVMESLKARPIEPGVNISKTNMPASFVLRYMNSYFYVFYRLEKLFKEKGIMELFDFHSSYALGRAYSYRMSNTIKGLDKTFAMELAGAYADRNNYVGEVLEEGCIVRFSYSNFELRKDGFYQKDLNIPYHVIVGLCDNGTLRSGIVRILGHDERSLTVFLPLGHISEGKHRVEFAFQKAFRKNGMLNVFCKIVVLGIKKN